MSGRTKSVSVHRLRRVARADERRLQRALDAGYSPLSLGLPNWARGVRTERIGLFQHAVVATEKRGH